MSRLCLVVCLLLVGVPAPTLAQRTISPRPSGSGYWIDCDRMEMLVFIPDMAPQAGQVIDLFLLPSRPPIDWSGDWRNWGKWRVAETVTLTVQTTSGPMQHRGYRVRPVGSVTWGGHNWRWRDPGEREPRPLRCEDIEIEQRPGDFEWS